ncbi:hypothetical protein EXIGLDRAFT_776821 [Exidia glandulosa HHB12029]|uniref:DUF6533 domain-containing protein n=1 Tax=Exidia glandulosa HHB12029 TaxID=1314781 RepID=A0A165ZMS8_EXIGL|nr:hypothetical protein EXIGLDRAFT_776821 [Exidia glandulosa HHB12029]
MANMSSIPPEYAPIIRNIEEHHGHLLATRYVTAAGAVIALFETVTSFPDELDLIWKGRQGFERTVFLVHRHIVLIGLFCAVQTGLAAVSICLMDGLVTLEVWQLWDCNWKMMRWMLSAFILQSVTTLGFLGGTVKTILGTPGGFTYTDAIQSCNLGVAPRLMAGSWASGIAFEVFILACIILNVLDRPRASHVRLTRLLLRDGCAYFIGVIALRTVNMVIAITSPPSAFFITTFGTWAVVTTLVNHLIINQCRERQRLRASVFLKGDLARIPSAALVSETYEMTVAEPANVYVQTTVSTHTDVTTDAFPYMI